MVPPGAATIIMPTIRGGVISTMDNKAGEAIVMEGWEEVGEAVDLAGIPTTIVPMAAVRVVNAISSYCIMEEIIIMSLVHACSV